MACHIHSNEKSYWKFSIDEKNVTYHVTTARKVTVTVTFCDKMLPFNVIMLGGKAMEDGRDMVGTWGGALIKWISALI